MRRATTGAQPNHITSEAPLSDGQVGGRRGSFSVLFPVATAPTVEGASVLPEYFPDLNLDQFVGSVTTDREEYKLAPFFYDHIEDVDTISYRQEVFRDLENPKVFEEISLFAERMREVRAQLAQARKLHYRYQSEGWFVDAVDLYCSAVASFAQKLARSELASRGLRDLIEYLSPYVGSPAFASLASGAKRVQQDLAEIQYSVQIRGLRVTVAKYDAETDYSAEVLTTFERFKQGTVKDYRVAFHDSPEMGHVEANVLALIARLYPAEFARLDEYYDLHQDFRDQTVRRFDREVQFYMSYLKHLGPHRDAGLSFCYPTVTRHSKEVFAKEAFDLVLAKRLLEGGSTVVCNDFHLEGKERALVVSGPNQGGKTTFARMFGQLHHLASIGCPVPGSEAQLYLFDRLYTQFEREETLSNMTGKLEDDLLRARRSLSTATSDSVIVMNEIFSSTTLQDALFLSTRMMDRLVELDVLSVFVTFIEELASFGPSTVSMVSTVVPENPAERTYKVVRRPADGLAYALAIANKYRLGYETLKERLHS